MDQYEPSFTLTMYYRNKPQAKVDVSGSVTNWIDEDGALHKELFTMFLKQAIEQFLRKKLE